MFNAPLHSTSIFLARKGLRRIDEFKAIAEKELEQDRKRQRKTYEDLLQKAGSKTRSKIDKQTASTDRINYKEKKYRSPIKVNHHFFSTRMCRLYN